MKVVIIGGVAGGASAAARLRRNDETAQIIMIERTGFVSYANCGLPYFVGGAISERGKLTLQTPESFRKRFNIDVRVRQEVVSIDSASHSVRVVNLANGTEYEETYDKLILSPGARPVVPDIPGVDSNGVFTLRTVEDTFGIYDFIGERKPKRAAVIGGGFIGLEMAENLMDRGMSVTLLQRPAHVMPTLDADMAALLQNRMRQEGISLMLKADVVGIEEHDPSLTVKVASGEEVPADIVIMAIGVRPENALAQDTGLELGMKGAIVVDDHMRTSDPDIYAVGDAVQVTHRVTDGPAVISLAGPANKQGRIAADNICGIERTFTGSQGSSVLKMFDLTVASTGLSLRAAKEAGIDADAVLLSSPSHATYYPGASNLRIKVVFDTKDGRILGAQIVGGEGADKRIDVLAVAVRASMSADDLAELDLAYAPPYSSAKDPVNMAGFMIQNIIDGMVEQVQWSDVASRPDEVVVLDVRTQAEYERGHLDDALHIPVDDLRARIAEVPHKRLYVHCQSGLRSYIACRILRQYGYECANVAGGWNYYESTMRDVQGPCELPA